METRFLLQPGDVFVTKDPQSLGRIIIFCESLRSQSKSAEYSHAGIILNDKGCTFEAVWNIEEQNLFEAYKGEKVLIARWTGMTPDNFKKGFDAVKPELGMTYPYARLGLYLLGLARFIHLGSGTVCSELAEKFLLNAGAVMMAGKNWWGMEPQTLCDEWRISKYFDVIFEGYL